MGRAHRLFMGRAHRLFMGRALVVVPTYNEAATLAQVVERTLAADEGLDVLVVDDGSPDGTGQLADRIAAGSDRVRVRHRAGKGGLGSAYRVGLGWGLEQGYDTLFEMDADLSHDPADLPRLAHGLAGADVVVGSRYVPGGGVVDWPWRRLALSRAGNRYVRAATGLPLADATAGFRGFRRAVLDDLNITSLRSEGYAFQVETALRAWRAGFRIVEVPITFVERREGMSKMDRRIVVEAVWRVARWALSGPRGPAGVHPASVAAMGSSAPPAGDAQERPGGRAQDGWTHAPDGHRGR